MNQREGVAKSIYWFSKAIKTTHAGLRAAPQSLADSTSKSQIINRVSLFKKNLINNEDMG